MSQSQYDSYLSLLGTVSDLVQEQYVPEIPNMVFRAGQVTNRIFKPSADGTTASGDGLNVQVITGFSDSARASRNVMKDFGGARQMSANKLKIRFNNNPSEAATGNDFLRLEAVAEINEIELRRGNDPGVALELAERTQSQMRDNYDDSHARLFYSTAEGKFAAVNGTPAQNDKDVFADCASYSNGGTSFRVPVDFGAFSGFKPGTHWDFYSSDTLLADECRVTDFNPVDGSVGFELTTKSTVSNCDNVADNADIYRSGEKGNGYRGSLRAWFDKPTSGESFIGGIDRTTSSYRYMNPIRYTPSSTAQQISRAQMDQLALAMGFVDDGQDMGSLVLTHTSTLQTLRNSIGEDALSTQDKKHNGEYNFGARRLTYIHPTFGEVTLLADPLHPTDRMHFLRASDWQLIPYLGAGLKIMPGDVANGFYRTSAASGDGSRSMYYRMEGYSLDTLWCKMPLKQGVLLNISA